MELVQQLNIVLDESNVDDMHIDITRNMLSFTEYLHVTGVNIDNFVFNEVWLKTYHIEDDVMFELTRDIIKSIGYKEKSENSNTNLLAFIKRKFKENIDYIFEKVELKNENILGMRSHPELKNKKNLGGSQKYTKIYMTRKAFQLLLIKVETQNSEQIHENLIQINKWFMDYNIKYQTLYQIKKERYDRENIIKEKDDKIDVLLKQNTEMFEKLENTENKLTNLTDDFKLLMKRTECIDDALKNEKCLHEETHRLLDEIKHENIDVKEKLGSVIDVVENVMEHIVPEIKEELLTDHLCILHDRNDLDHYYFIRAQCRVIQRSVKLIQKEYPGMYVLIDEIDYTHPKNLFVLFKNHLKEHNDEFVFVNYNHVHVFENYITHSTRPQDHKIVKILNDIKNGIIRPIKETIDDMKH